VAAAAAAVAGETGGGRVELGDGDGQEDDEAGRGDEAGGGLQATGAQLGGGGSAGDTD
jgi:hypothetical protein